MGQAQHTPKWANGPNPKRAQAQTKYCYRPKENPRQQTGSRPAPIFHHRRPHHRQRREDIVTSRPTGHPTDLIKKNSGSTDIHQQHPINLTTTKTGLCRSTTAADQQPITTQTPLATTSRTPPNHHRPPPPQNPRTPPPIDATQARADQDQKMKISNRIQPKQLREQENQKNFLKTAGDPHLEDPNRHTESDCRRRPTPHGARRTTTTNSTNLHQRPNSLASINSQTQPSHHHMPPRRQDRLPNPNRNHQNHPICRGTAQTDPLHTAAPAPSSR